MNLLVIDGQGGQLGSTIIKTVLKTFPEINIMAVGTNSAATSAMVKAGAATAATGENPVAVACKKADVIMGPVGIVIADSLLGEITPSMAVSTGSSNALKILIPINKCDNLIAGVSTKNMSSLIDDAIEKLKFFITSQHTNK